jgi:SAM-dependent methyltransferase
MVSGFIPMEFHDVRPPDLELENLRVKANSLEKLDIPDHSVASLSCMHVLEHLGLGRYGDPLDPNADLTGIAELKRILAPGGNLLIVVPLGTPKVMFNGQRVYSFDLIKDYFGELELREFAFIPDFASDGHLIRNPIPDRIASFRSGCGCFWFKEKMI